MTKKSIYFIRHAEVYNPNKLCFGQSEMPLEENFTVQFDGIKDKLNLINGAVFYSSPLRRCTKLASYLSDENFVVNELISDVNFGVWEMKEWKEIPAKQIDAWREDFVNYKVKGGESFNDVYERSVDFFEKILITGVEENAVVITHSGIIRSIVSYVLDFPLVNLFNLQIDYSSISKITYDTDSGVCCVAFLNSTAELITTKITD